MRLIARILDGLGSACCWMGDHLANISIRLQDAAARLKWK